MNIFDLSGKTALITGSSRGLGEGFARALSSAGARVILAARRKEKLNSLAKELGNAISIEMDISDKKDVTSAFETLEQLQEKIDICINNAGIADLTPLFDEDQENKFEKILQTNLMGAWYVTHQVAVHMKRHKIEGSIINIGSINGDLLPASGATAYSTSKAAVNHMVRVLVNELSPYKIRINAISPGFFKTDMTREIARSEALLKRIPLSFVADPADLDGAILFLSSNRASRYVTGCCITIDGGISWT